jgi:hypothetical protein
MWRFTVNAGTPQQSSAGTHLWKVWQKRCELMPLAAADADVCIVHAGLAVAVDRLGLELLELELPIPVERLGLGKQLMWSDPLKRGTTVRQGAIHAGNATALAGGTSVTNCVCCWLHPLAPGMCISSNMP